MTLAQYVKKNAHKDVMVHVILKMVHANVNIGITEVGVTKSANMDAKITAIKIQATANVEKILLAMTAANVWMADTETTVIILVRKAATAARVT